MKSSRIILSVVALAALTTIVFSAQKKEVASLRAPAPSAEQHKVFDAANLEWADAPPAFPAGAKFALLYGDPSKTGVYTVRLRVPAGYKIPAHTHPTAELVTVISGTFHVGMGDKLDEGAGDNLAAGGFAAMPAGMKHYAWFTEESVVQVDGQGPFQINYVDPADDPRNAKK